MDGCPNCGAVVVDNYCARCGQRLIDLDRPFLDLLGEVLQETFEVDGRTFRTLRALLLRPGAITTD